jgi:uncharacterized membrane protein YfhO
MLLKWVLIFTISIKILYISNFKCSYLQVIIYLLFQDYCKDINSSNLINLDRIISNSSLDINPG